MQNLDALHRTARRLTRHTQDAEDLVQETYLRAWRSLHTYRPGTNSRAWLFRILRNVHVDRLRASSRAAKTAAEVERDERVQVAHETPESLFMARLVDAEVRQALLQVPDAYRACVILSDLEGASYPKIMDRLGIPRGTVMSRLFRGRRAMRDLLTAYGREHGYLKASLRGERIAVFLLIATLSGFAPFAPMPHAAAQGNGGYQIVVGPTVQGAVTQKFATQRPYYMISVDGTPYTVSVEFFNQVVVGSIVRFDGANSTVISGGISDPK